MSRPDPEILERNLRNLLRRAWRPVGVRPAFRAELRARVLASVAAGASPDAAEPHDAPRPRRVTRPLLALAATVLALFAAAFLLLRDERSPSAHELIAAGRVAIRTAPDGLWRAADAPRLALAPAAAFLEVLTPGHASFLVETEGRDGPAGDLVLGGAAHARVTTGAGDAALETWIERGALRVNRRADSGSATLVTPHGTLSLAAGDLSLRVPPAGADGGAVTFDFSAGQAWHLPAAAAPDASAPPVPLVPGTRYRLFFDRLDVLEGPPAPLRPVDPGAWIRERAEAAGTAAVTPPAGEVQIEAVVRDGPSGAAVARFTAWMVPLDFGAPGEVGQPAFGEPSRSFAVDDPAGRFVASGLPPGTWRLFVAAADRAPWHSEPLRLGGGETHRLEVALCPGVRLVGRVLDDATGRPVGGAWVHSLVDAAALLLPMHLDEGEAPPFGVRSEADGTFDLRHASPGTQRLRAARAGHAPRVAVLDGLRDGDTRAGLEIRLGQGGAVTGQVRDDRGRPLPDAYVAVMPGVLEDGAYGLPAGFTATDLDGRYRVDDLTPGAVVVVNLGLQPRSGARSAVEVRPTVVPAGDAVVVDFGGERAGTRLAGRIVDAAGDPWPTFLSLVRASEVDRGAEADWSGAPTDEQGGFVVYGLTPGMHEIYAADLRGRLRVHVGSVDVPAAEEHRIELRLPVEALHGRVVDDLGGAPVPRAVAVVFRERPGDEEEFVAATLAGEDGAFGPVPVGAGTYRLQVHATSGELAMSEQEHVVLAPGRSATLEFRARPGAPLTVDARGPDGAPIAGARVTLIGSNGRRYELSESPRTDAAGRLVMHGVPQGDWHVEVVHGGFAPAVKPLRVTAGVPQVLEFSLERAGD